MSRFHSLTIADRREETPDCISLAFIVPEDLQEEFQYAHGQYLTLRARVEGEELRRSYSLCSSPLDKEWRVAVKKIVDGRFSGFVHTHLQAGDQVEVMPPNGRFSVKIDASRPKSYVAFAAGSGITPILSILKTHLALEPDCSWKLFYFNQRVSSIILKEEIEGLKNQFLERLEVFHFLTQEERNIPLFQGRLDEAKLETLTNTLFETKGIDDYFICGPEQMIFQVRDFLLEKGVDASAIHFELFKSSSGAVRVQKSKNVSARQGASCEVEILEGGKRLRFEIPQGQTSILDAALARSADLPFACKGGVCCTCRAKLLEGKVDMAVNYALEQEELDAGYILTCQAVPISEKIVVDFDG